MNILNIIFLATIQIFAVSNESQKSLCIDLTDFEGLKKNSHYQLIISDPCDYSKNDTLYWENEKTFTTPIDDSWGDCLAFVNISLTDKEQNCTDRLASTVVALEEGDITIKAIRNGGIILSGSKSNEFISDLWKSGILMKSYKKFKNHLKEELDKNSDNLYGAYLYSLDTAIDMFAGKASKEMLEATKGDCSPVLLAIWLTENIKMDDSYAAEKCISPVFFEEIKISGDVSPLIVNQFYKYMTPY